MNEDNGSVEILQEETEKNSMDSALNNKEIVNLWLKAKESLEKINNNIKSQEKLLFILFELSQKVFVNVVEKENVGLDEFASVFFALGNTYGRVLLSEKKIESLIKFYKPIEQIVQTLSNPIQREELLLVDQDTAKAAKFSYSFCTITDVILPELTHIQSDLQDIVITEIEIPELDIVNIDKKMIKESEEMHIHRISEFSNQVMNSLEISEKMISKKNPFITSLKKLYENFTTQNNTETKNQIQAEKKPTPNPGDSTEPFYKRKRYLIVFGVFILISLVALAAAVASGAILFLGFPHIAAVVGIATAITILSVAKPAFIISASIGLGSLVIAMLSTFIDTIKESYDFFKMLKRNNKEEVHVNLKTLTPQELQKTSDIETLLNERENNVVPFNQHQGNDDFNQNKTIEASFGPESRNDTLNIS
ncbi:MAG: hypothetical protein LEGION0398_MBIBDBAK_00088 [Legionellaceae bacterium]